MRILFVTVFCLLAAAINACQLNCPTKRSYTPVPQNCCSPPCKKSDCCSCKLGYNNFCTDFKGPPIKLCELSGSYVVVAATEDLNKLEARNLVCPVVSLAVDCGKGCQGQASYLYKLTNTTGGTVGFDIFIHSIRSCGVWEATASNNAIAIGHDILPYMYNIAVVHHNDAGIAVVMCQAFGGTSPIYGMVLINSFDPTNFELEDLLQQLRDHSEQRVYSVDTTKC